MSKRLGEGVWWFDLDVVNAYLVEDDVLTLVDAGMPWDAGRIRNGVTEAGFEVGEIDRVLVTHFDLDHVGGLGHFSALDADVFVGERDADFVAGRRSPVFSSRKSAFQRIADLFRSLPEGRVIPVEDGDEFGTFTAVHTPGHTLGHTAYVSEKRDVAFVGDLVTGGDDGLSYSPWYFSEDTAAVAESLDRLVAAMPPVSIVAPGHGVPVVDGGYSALADLVE